MSQYDVIVVGAGPGGYVAAVRAAQRGAKVAVVEREYLGGVCLNVGCIPSKTLIHTANLYRTLQEADSFGLKVSEVSVDLEKLIARKQKVVDLNTSGVRNLLKTNGIDHIEGEAHIPAAGKVVVGDTPYTTSNIIVATGGRPAQLPGLEINGKTIIGSTEALSLTTLPKRVAVIGAGAIGAEFACLWNAFGVEVILIEAMDSILPREDEELTKRLATLFKRRKMDVRPGTKVAKLEDEAGDVTLTLEGKHAGEVNADLVLVSIGLQCNSEVLAPELGIKLDSRGGIPVNERMETPVKGIYAIGDVINRTWLAHGASREGIVAATNCTKGNQKMDYRVVPSCVFCAPEIAHVGLSEAEALDKGYTVKVGKFMFSANGRAHAMGETDGLVKIIGDAKTDELLGMHIMGHEASELIAVGALGMRMEATVEEIVATIHTHPTLAEAIHEAAEDYFGLSIHTPAKRN